MIPCFLIIHDFTTPLHFATILDHSMTQWNPTTIMIRLLRYFLRVVCDTPTELSDCLPTQIMIIADNAFPLASFSLSPTSQCDSSPSLVTSHWPICNHDCGELLDNPQRTCRYRHSPFASLPFRYRSSLSHPRSEGELLSFWIFPPCNNDHYELRVTSCCPPDFTLPITTSS